MGEREGPSFYKARSLYAFCLPGYPWVTTVSTYGLMYPLEYKTLYSVLCISIILHMLYRTQARAEQTNEENAPQPAEPTG